ncbi:MAG: LysR family transcriptional regulator [Bdellovibrionales bacterium]
MDINQLKYFCAIARTGSMRKAAEILNISPPALSKTTRLLQDELGVTLITHVGRNIVLTDQGQQLADRAEILIKNFESMRTEIEQGKPVDEEVRIATFEVFSTYALELLNHIEWNEKRMVVHDVLPGELEQAMVQRQVDFGITYLPIPHPELEHLKVGAIEMGVYTHSDAFKGVKQNELPFVVPALPISGSPSRVRGLDGWPDDAYPRKVRYKVTLMESALELVRQGRAAGFFPVFVVELHNKRVREDLRLVRRPSIYKGRICTTDVYLVKRRGDVESTQHKQIARALRLIFK